MLTDNEMKLIEAEARAAGGYVTAGGGFPQELVERCATPEAVEAGLAAAEELEELLANARPKPRPNAKVAASWQAVLERMNSQSI